MGINTMMELAGFSFRKFRVGGDKLSKIPKNCAKTEEFPKIAKNCMKTKEFGGIMGGQAQGGQTRILRFFLDPPPPTVENPD